MVNLSGFDPNNYEPLGDFDPVPPGRYTVVITKTEDKPTKSGSGSFMELTFVITEGEFKGRQLWARLNLENKNAKAVEIARSELATIYRALGIQELQDSAGLHDRPLVVKVCHENYNGTVRNEIKNYYPIEPAKPAQPPVKPAAPAKNWGRA